MIYSFITNKDIDVSIKQYFLDQLVKDVPHVLKTAEGAAVSLMKSMLNSRYDLTLLFPPIKEWDVEKAYETDQYVCIDDVIYKAIADSEGESPDAEESEFWEESDPRDSLLVLHCVNITLFFLWKRANPRKEAEDVIAAYNRAVNWLEDVKNKHENPDFPLIEEDGGEIRYGSNEKLDHYW